MHSPATLPQLSAARVLTSGGPYEAGALLSLAFVDPLVGRLVAHEARDEQWEVRPAAIVPETISVVLLAAAPPYENGETIALSFIDPAIARIHRCATNESAPRAAKPVSEIVRNETHPRVTAAQPRNSNMHVGLRLEWTTARVGRLLSLSEKLLALDRLGWYRHALAMRLLLPDEVILADAEANESAARQLRALKMAATEALGTPLLAALMPNFTLDEEWLRSIETPALARAAAALRDTLNEHANQGAPVPASSTQISIGSLSRTEIERAGNGLDAFLATLIPCEGGAPDLAGCLRDYKAALLELFGQTSQASTTVRTTRLATPNPVLDERLAAVAREIDRAFGRRAVA